MLLKNIVSNLISLMLSEICLMSFTQRIGTPKLAYKNIWGRKIFFSTQQSKVNWFHLPLKRYLHNSIIAICFIKRLQRTLKKYTYFRLKYFSNDIYLRVSIAHFEIRFFTNPVGNHRFIKVNNLSYEDVFIPNRYINIIHSKQPNWFRIVAA